MKRKAGNEIDGYKPTEFHSYNAQSDAVNNVYDAAKELQLLELKNAFDASRADLDVERNKIPAIYQAQRNNAASESALQGRSFNEYAAASGLNSGTGGQAALARSNVLQGNLAAIDLKEAGARQDLENQGLKLKLQYENDVAAAVAKGEYERAAALLKEYQRAEESNVETGRAQADENYRAYEARQREREWLADEDYRNSQYDFEREKWQTERERLGVEDARERAETLAKYGDFSGYSALGYDEAAIEGMRKAWIAANPLLAYNTGAITAQQYYAMTGKSVGGSSRSSGSGGGSSAGSQSSSSDVEKDPVQELIDKYNETAKRRKYVSKGDRDFVRMTIGG